MNSCQSSLGHHSHLILEKACWVSLRGISIVESFLEFVDVRWDVSLIPAYVGLHYIGVSCPCYVTGENIYIIGRGRKWEVLLCQYFSLPLILYPHPHWLWTIFDNVQLQLGISKCDVACGISDTFINRILLIQLELLWWSEVPSIVRVVSDIELSESGCTYLRSS